MSTYLLRSQSGKFIDIGEGVTKFKHKFRIPEDLPSSFEGEFGYIRYTVHVKLKVPSAIDLTAEETISIMRQDKLNDFPKLQELHKEEGLELLGCCHFCFKPEFIIVKVVLPRTVFVEGENIPMRIVIMNRSPLEVLKTTVKLNRLETFLGAISDQFPDMKTKVIVDLISESHFRGGKPKGRYEFDEELEMPHDLIPSNDRFCSICSTSYELEVRLISSGTDVSPVAKIPITICSVQTRRPKRLKQVASAMISECKKS